MAVVAAAVPNWSLLSPYTEQMTALTSFNAILKSQILQP